MTDRMIENRVRKLQELEAQAAEIEKQAEAVRAELKADLEAKGAEEIVTANGTAVRFKRIESQRFDASKFRAEYESLYPDFCKTVVSFRFSYGMRA